MFVLGTCNRFALSGELHKSPVIVSRPLPVSRYCSAIIWSIRLIELDQR